MRPCFARRSLFWFAALVPLAGCGGCGPNGETDSGTPPILDPEPPGAPVDPAGGQLGCLGDNLPPPGTGVSVELTGYVRAFANVENTMGTCCCNGTCGPCSADCMAVGACCDPQPVVLVDVFDENGVSLLVPGGPVGSDVTDGRVAVNVPAVETGWIGSVLVTGMGYVDYWFKTSRPVTNSDVNGWAWLMTQDELDANATGAGVVLDPAMGVVLGAVHDCDVFGVENAVIVWDGATDGVFYVSDWAIDPARTFTGVSGRFAIPNVPPGTLTLEAYGRTSAGGPLELLSLVDVEIEAGNVHGVGLEMRMGVTR